MFVYSVKTSKMKIAVMLAAVAVVAAGIVFVALRGGEPAANDGAISLTAGNAQERVAFLSQFGWKITEDPIEVAEVIIPAEFDEVYTKYNELQKTQNFDLQPYSTMRVKRWTYEVLNYPGYENRSGVVQANLLIYDGVVIGGDICSVELDGFMQGFDFPESARETTAGTTSGDRAETSEKTTAATVPAAQ